MSHECHHGTCTQEGQSHSHNPQGCSICYHQHQCDCECHTHHHKYSDELLDLADEAWMEVVKEKIKEEILQHSGKHISQLAKVVAGANHTRWTCKLDEKKNQEEYETLLRSLMFQKQKK